MAAMTQAAALQEEIKTKDEAHAKAVDALARAQLSRLLDAREYQASTSVLEAPSQAGEGPTIAEVFASLDKSLVEKSEGVDFYDSSSSCSFSRSGPSRYGSSSSVFPSSGGVGQSSRFRRILEDESEEDASEAPSSHHDCRPAKKLKKSDLKDGESSEAETRSGTPAFNRVPSNPSPSTSPTAEQQKYDF